MPQPLHLQYIGAGFLPYVHHMSAQGIRPGLYQQRRAADTILPSGGAQQPGDNTHQIFHAANLMQDADIAVRIVPSEGELDAAVRQAPAHGHHRFRLRVNAFDAAGLPRSLPEHQHIAGDGQRRIPDDQPVKFSAEFPVDLPHTVAGDVFPNLERLRQVGAGPLLRIGVAVLLTVGIGDQIHPNGESVRLHRHVRFRAASAGDADEAETVVELHLLHGDLDTPAVFASQAQGRAPLPFRERPCHDIPGTALAVQLIPGRYPAADTQGGQQRGVFQTDRDAALVPFPHHGGCFHPHPKPFSQEKVDRKAAQRQNQQRRRQSQRAAAPVIQGKPDADALQHRPTQFHCDHKQYLLPFVVSFIA